MRLHEIFTSISGEIGHYPQGSLVTFIRLHGCNLACSWCDTEASISGLCKFDKSPKEIVQYLIDNRKPRLVVITGGEPLYQETELVELVETLQAAHFTVQIETNGTYILPASIGMRCAWVVDIKPPSAGDYRDRTLTPQHILDALSVDVYLKFPVQDAKDIEAAEFYIDELVHIVSNSGRMAKFKAIALSPVAPMPHERCLEVLKKYQERFPFIPFCLNVQLHRMLNER